MTLTSHGWKLLRNFNIQEILVTRSLGLHELRMMPPTSFLSRINRGHIAKCFAVLTVSVFVLLVYFIPPLQRRLQHIAEKMDLVQDKWSSESLNNLPPGFKSILVYTPYFGRIPWPLFQGKEKQLSGRGGKKCTVSSCYISYHRDDFDRSDAVLFHSSDMPPRTRLEEILWRKPKGQKWIWYSLENPVKTKIYSYSVESFHGVFDLIMSYRTDSSVYAPYGYYEVKHSNDSINIDNIIAKKDRLLLWQVSNCDARLRIKIAQAINRHIHVDVYGDCQKYFNHTGKCSRWTNNCDQLSKRYKFYLAFENYHCPDYVTEKYWNNALARNIVPVLVAGSYNKQLLIPGSYIDILDFQDAKSLAKYLLYLDSNTTAYKEYFEWRRNYTFYTDSTDWLCDLCEAVHKNNSRKIDLEKFWSVSTCHEDDWHIKNTWLKSCVGQRIGNWIMLFYFAIVAISF